MMASLAAYTVTYNCKRIDYPFIASIESSLALADLVVVCDANSTDGTWEDLQSLAAKESRLELCRHRWGSHYSILPTICNGLLENSKVKGSDFAIQIQADEVCCEWTFDATRKFLDNYDPNAGLGKPFYRNFCPDTKTTFPFIYERKSVLSRVSTGVRWDINGDACALVGLPSAELPLEIHHMGKVCKGRETAALIKEICMQTMYIARNDEEQAHIGGNFPDPAVLEQIASGKMDYKGLFKSAEFTPYDGPHPKFLKEWISKH